MNDIGLAGLWFIFLGCLCLVLAFKQDPNFRPSKYVPYEQWSAKLKVCTEGEFWKFYTYCLQEFTGLPHGPELEKFDKEWRRVGELKKSGRPME